MFGGFGTAASTPEHYLLPTVKEYFSGGMASLKLTFFQVFKVVLHGLLMVHQRTLQLFLVLPLTTGRKATALHIAQAYGVIYTMTTGWQFNGFDYDNLGAALYDNMPIYTTTDSGNGRLDEYSSWLYSINHADVRFHSPNGGSENAAHGFGNDLSRWCANS